MTVHGLPDVQQKGFEVRMMNACAQDVAAQGSGSELRLGIRTTWDGYPGHLLAQRPYILGLLGLKDLK